MDTQPSPPRLALAVLCLAQFMVTLDVTVVTVANPKLQRGLDIAPAHLPWVTTAYALTFGGFLVLAGRAGDLLGKRRVFISGIVLFTVASALCGASQQGWHIFAARGVQGLGAAMVVPSTLALLTTTFGEGPERNKAMAVWSAVASLGAVSGYAVGGLLTDLLGWRSVFLVNVPIGVFAVLQARRLAQPARQDGGSRLDLFGAATLTSGLVLTVFAITSVSDRGFSPLISSVLAVGLAVLVVFVLIERRHPEPLVRFDIFRNRNVLAGNLINLTNTAGPAAIVFFTALYLQEVLHFTPLQAGLSFAPVTVLGALLVRQTATLMDKLGPRVLLIAGPAGAVLGALWLSRAPVGGNYFVDVLPGILLTSFGSMLAYAPSMIVATSKVPDSQQGLASGLVSTSQQIGGALGLAVFGTLAAAVTESSARQGNAALLDGYHFGYGGAAGVQLLTVITGITVVRQVALAKPRAADEPETGKPA